MKRFEQNIDLDAILVLAAMRGGMDAIMQIAFMMRDVFPTTKLATDRCAWLKKQNKEYIEKVSNRVVELERGERK